MWRRIYWLYTGGRDTMEIYFYYTRGGRAIAGLPPFLPVDCSAGLTKITRLIGTFASDAVYLGARICAPLCSAKTNTRESAPFPDRSASCCFWHSRSIRDGVVRCKYNAMSYNARGPERDGVGPWLGRRVSRNKKKCKKKSRKKNSVRN